MTQAATMSLGNAAAVVAAQALGDEDALADRDPIRASSSDRDQQRRALRPRSIFAMRPGCKGPRIRAELVDHETPATRSPLALAISRLLQSL
jgi:hypothetical protein